MLESNLLITPPIFDHPQAIHDPNTGFIHPLIHMYPWKSTKRYLSFQHGPTPPAIIAQEP